VQPRKQPWYKLNKTNYLAIGSILAHATKDSVVWGSGIVDKTHTIAKADFRAVRGPRTRQFLKELGYECPAVYGDPALLLPRYYDLEIRKEYKVGIVPHYVDYPFAKKMYQGNGEISVIDLLTQQVEQTTKEILSCQYIISSSLHGIIVAHAYGIPAVWVKFSDKIFGDDIKYFDYFESVDIETPTPIEIKAFISEKDLLEIVRDRSTLPKQEKIKTLQEALLRACPFLD
jgi:polysaccharide pyruvyl transferase WcaK-like protein